MENWFNKKQENEPVEDFVLFNEKNLEDTDNIDVEKIAAELDKNNSFKKKKLIVSAIAGVLVIAMLSAIIFGTIALADPLRGYTLVAAQKGNIEYMMDVSGVITAENRYEITSLVSGKIIESDYEVGDIVKAGDVIYKLDDTDAKLSVERAKSEVDRASDGSGSSSSRICSTAEGTIKSLSIYAGANVNPGSVVAVISKEDGSSEAVMTYIAGRISMVNVRVGQNVSVGQVMASVDTKNGDSSTYDVKIGEINLQSAQRHLSNYTIQAPASGMIVEKNAKTGDNVAMTDTDKPMMVIVDTNNLSFKFSVDEYKVREVKKGQAVIIRTESLPDETFEGTVSAVGIEGYEGADGKTMFDVTVTVTDAKKLMAGMKVTAQVVLTSVKKALTVPKAALMKSDGVEALVIVKYNEDETIPEKILNKSLENKLEYPDIKVPKNCVLLKVEYGASDNDNVEIVSGIELSDIVVYKADVQEELVPSEYISSYDYYDDLNEADEDILELEDSIEKEIEKIMQNQI